MPAALDVCEITGPSCRYARWGVAPLRLAANAIPCERRFKEGLPLRPGPGCDRHRMTERFGKYGTFIGGQFQVEAYKLRGDRRKFASCGEKGRNDPWSPPGGCHGYKKERKARPVNPQSGVLWGNRSVLYSTTALVVATTSLLDSCW